MWGFSENYFVKIKLRKLSQLAEISPVHVCITFNIDFKCSVSETESGPPHWTLLTDVPQRAPEMHGHLRKDAKNH